MKIGELKEKYGDGEKLEIQVDNDTTWIGFKDDLDDDGDQIKIMDGDGYQDVVELWKLLFPKAECDWC